MHSLAPPRQGPRAHTNGMRKKGNVKYYPQTKWLHFHSLFALSEVWSTLVFVPNIKDIAVLQIQKDTYLFTIQKAGDTAAWCFSSFITCGKTGLLTLVPVSCPTGWAPPHSDETPELWLSSLIHLGSLHPSASGHCKSYQYCYRVKRTAAKA